MWFVCLPNFSFCFHAALTVFSAFCSLNGSRHSRRISIDAKQHPARYFEALKIIHKNPTRCLLFTCQNATSQKSQINYNFERKANIIPACDTPDTNFRPRVWQVSASDYFLRTSEWILFQFFFRFLLLARCLLWFSIKRISYRTMPRHNLQILSITVYSHKAFASLLRPKGSFACNVWFILLTMLGWMFLYRSQSWTDERQARLKKNSLEKSFFL